MAIVFEISPDILKVIISGTLDRRTAEKEYIKAADIMREHDLYKELVDLRQAEVNYSTTDIYQFVSSFADVYPRRTKHALVQSLEEFDEEQSQFGETVAFNRGIYMKVFTDVDEALAWLHASEMVSHQGQHSLKVFENLT